MHNHIKIKIWYQLLWMLSLKRGVYVMRLVDDGIIIADFYYKNNCLKNIIFKIFINIFI